jgi:ABC-type nitrate/sulfonate/bicarbonate transport system permease component
VALAPPVASLRQARYSPSHLVRSAAYAGAIYVGPAILLLVVWDLASRAFGLPRLFPTPFTTFRTLGRLLADGTLAANAVASMARILAGFALGGLLGTGLGLLMGVSRLARWALDPYVDFLRFVSAVAWISTFMIWFGIGEGSKIALLTYATAFGVAINVTAGVRALPPARVQVAQCFGASRFQMFRWVVLPGTVPHIVSGFRIAMQNAFMVIVVAEMIAASQGLGFLITTARTFLAPDRVFVAILALGVLGFLTDRALVLGASLLLARYQRPA